jgi:diguanylate cyclase (GGDEF)-like protein
MLPRRIVDTRAAPKVGAMIAVEPLLGIVASAIVICVAMAALIVAALNGRGPLYGRFLEIDRSGGKQADAQAEPGSDSTGDTAARDAINVGSTVRLLARDRRPSARADAMARRGRRPIDGEMDEVLRGSFALDTYHRAIRVLAWSFILITMLVVSASQLWEPVQPQIYATIILAGIFVLAVHELMPPGSLSAIRVVIEGTAAIVFLTMLVMLTGNSSSPFFFLLALLIGGAALAAAPGVTVILTVETVIAYVVASFSTPVEATDFRITLARVAINVTALILLSYSGMVVARVQRRTREAAIRLSTVDSLTDLYNRAYFFNAVEHEIQRGKRFRRGFCLLMMDLDGLKSINDRYGHYQGDVVLRGVAQLIRAGLRGIDVAARYGGDEFVALLPETDPSGAYVVAEKIRQMVTELLVESSGHQITTSISIGVVSYPEDGQTADELMIAADEAMYSSKRLGKNRVVGYAEPGELGQPAPLSHRQQVVTPGFRPLPRHDDGWPPEAGGRR